MYDKFGNFNSAEEINACAEELKEQGELGKLKELAEENGIPGFFAEQYAEGMSEEFTVVLQIRCTSSMQIRCA